MFAPFAATQINKNAMNRKFSALLTFIIILASCNGGGTNPGHPADAPTAETNQAVPAADESQKQALEESKRQIKDSILAARDSVVEANSPK